ncbi:MAG: hypothetical protein HY815_02755, partial [Candidatus Riflebacteria bacterium]|nr:hypothetical protein [Candidatus Riflebacteria bacterium]
STRGIRELTRTERLMAPGRARRPGAGRKRLEHQDPAFHRALEAIIVESTGRGLTGLLRWTTMSTKALAAQLTRQGHRVTDETVRRKLRELGYSLQARGGAKEAATPHGAVQQFPYIAKLARAFVSRGAPVLAIDTRKSRIHRTGRDAEPRAQLIDGSGEACPPFSHPAAGAPPALARTASSSRQRLGAAELAHDTAEFAVESLRRWWRLFGRRYYSRARELLLCTAGRGATGRQRLAWLHHLQQVADQLGLRVTVCHYPPGTFKWIKVEHRMFSRITMTRKEQPVLEYESVVSLIGAIPGRGGSRAGPASARPPPSASAKGAAWDVSRMSGRWNVDDETWKRPESQG